MPPWSALAGYAQTLSLPGGETLFYYDSFTPAGGAVHAGGGRPTLMLIHGLGDEADTWRHLFPLLAPRFRILAPDLPGFGRSLVQGRVSVRRHIQAALYLLEHAAPGSEAIFAGNSMGALIAQGTAFALPHRTRLLILIDGAFPSDMKASPGLLLAALPGIGNSHYRRFRQDHEGAWRSLFPYYADLDALSGADKAFLRERVIARVESRSQERAYFQSYRSLIWKQLATGADMGVDMLRFCGESEGSGKVSFIWGEADRILPPETAALAREFAPGGSFTLIPGAGHLPQQEKPAETAAAIRDAIAGSAPITGADGKF